MAPNILPYKLHKAYVPKSGRFLWEYSLEMITTINTCHVPMERTLITPSEPPKPIQGPSVVVDERVRNSMLAIKKGSKHTFRTRAAP